MAKARAVTVQKVKKKFWHPILAPKEQNNVVLGETYVPDAEAAVGKTLQANLKTITDNLRDQNAYLTFKITKLAGKNLHTEVTGYFITGPSMKKVTRRNTNRIDDSFVVVTKDSKKVRIKPLAVTLHSTVRSIETSLRSKLRQILAHEVKSLTFNELVVKLTSRQIQSIMKKRLAKIYPLRAFEVKVLEMAREGRTVKAKEGEEIVEPTVVAKKVKKEKKPKKTVSEEMVEELTAKKEEEKAAAQDSEDFGNE